MNRRYLHLQIEKIATNKGLRKEEVLIELMAKDYISFDKEMKTDKLQEFIYEYLELIGVVSDVILVDLINKTVRRTKRETSETLLIFSIMLFSSISESNNIVSYK